MTSWGWTATRFALIAALQTALVCCAARAQTPAPEAAPPAEALEPEPGPVEWLAWAPETFQRARKEDKGILLTIVSRSCRPCATADEEIYSDPGVRRSIARRWIPVRVDRDERPDIESRYQLAANWFTSGKAGLPVTAFLFHTGETMWADTYIPLENREGKPGLRSLLVSTDHLWRVRFTEAQSNARFIQMSFDAEKEAARGVTASKELLAALVDSTIAHADPDHGGFGEAPRITNPYAAQLALLASARRRDDGMRDLGVRALKAAISGAGFDRIDGGFHRAARDEAWLVAQWDKPLAVNAAYLLALADAFRVTADPAIRDAAVKTIDFILSRLRSPDGGFYSQIAPSSDVRDEAGYYTFTVAEVKQALPADDLKWARALFGFRDEGELLLGLPPRFTLKQVLDPGEAARGASVDAGTLRLTATRIVDALAAIRKLRPAPPVSEARYLDSTALAASGLVHAGAVFDRRDAIDAALASLDAILSKESPGDGVPHRLDPGRAPSSPILMADQVLLGAALLDAHEITGEPRYLAAASAVAAGVPKAFGDEEGGGLYDILQDPNAAGYLKLRRKIPFDGVTPSPAGSAALFLSRVAARTHDETLARVATRSVEWASRHALALDQRLATVGVALDALVAAQVRITVPAGDGPARALRLAAFKAYAPGRVVENAAPGVRTATVCVGDRCREGLSDPGAIAGAIAARP
ncbi:MAG: thioredoxin domain-containing protein [Acidobacteria bacterium]|nr:thioredoxin domain-containing protein [Acidobacteriota bacterium]